MNLMTLFGDTYRVTLEESWYCECPKPSKLKPAFYQIKGRYGVIYPWDADFVEVYVTSRRKIAVLELNPRCQVKNRYDDAASFLLPLPDISVAFEIIRPKKRRCLSLEQRKAASERLTKWRSTQKSLYREGLQPRKNEKAGLSAITGVQPLGSQANAPGI